MDLPQKYSAKYIEAKWRAFWEKEHVYTFNPNTDKEIFSIDTPPPTVSGYMHAGHSFSYSQQDFVARFQRMRGKEVFYPFGTDDNGLATERLIERMKNVKSAQLSRKEFIKLCLATLNEIRPRFVQDWKNLGMSCDFDIFYSTINDHCRKISQRSFLELYKAGREYRKESPTMWCPECQTAIAQVELEDKNLKSHFVDLRFALVDPAVKGSKVKSPAEVIIATTRPEMLPACVAIFVHPDDKRYKQLVGKKARVPLFNQEVTILSDERANPEKGTGAVMCCTFGDQTDIEWYKAHNLALKVAIGKDGHMTPLAGSYAGLKIRDARKKIIDDLKKEELLVAQKEIEHAVNVHERCGIEVEILQSKQWFIRYLDLREQFLDYGAKLNWYPAFMKSRYDNWIKGLQWDWCISRQRHFGVPFPVWYCEKCDEPILAREEDLPVDPLEDKAPVGSCPKCKHTTFVPEKDVLDTWATSSLTPRLAIELYKDHPVFKKLYPMHLRPQAHDIISFWLFNTVVKSCLHYTTIPWHDVAISGWLLAPDGTKMSKSKGNTMVPQDVMEKYSADALRFMAASSKLGEDMPYLEKEVVTGSKTVVKLFNAVKFTVMNLEGYEGRKPKKLCTLDAWILSKLQRLIESASESFLVYEYSHAKQETDIFFWQVFCDNYLEVIKDRIYNRAAYTQEEVLSAQYTLYHTSLAIIKLFAPIIPHITEEVYHFFYDRIEGVPSVHRTAWPEANKALINTKAEQAGNILVAIVAAVRKYKSEKQVSLKAPIATLTIACTREQKEQVQELERDLKSVTHAQKIVFTKTDPLALTTQDKKEALGKEFVTLPDYKIHVKIELGEEEKK